VCVDLGRWLARRVAVRAFLRSTGVAHVARADDGADEIRRKPQAHPYARAAIDAMNHSRAADARQHAQQPRWLSHDRSTLH